jgi:Fe-S cluster assembly iron-binding protein IscA
LLLVKNPDYLIIWDEIESPQTTEWFLHTTAKEIQFLPNLATGITEYGVMLDVHNLIPNKSFDPKFYSGKFGQWYYDQDGRIKGKEDPYPFHFLNYIKNTAEASQDYVTILNSRRVGEKALNISITHTGEKTYQLSVEGVNFIDKIKLNSTDVVFKRNSGDPVIINKQDFR